MLPACEAVVVGVAVTAAEVLGVVVRAAASRSLCCDLGQLTCRFVL